MRTPIIAVLALLLSASTVSARKLIEVTTCGQEVPAGAIGYLTADLTCTGLDEPSSAVVLGANATLDLRGFSLVTETRGGVGCSRPSGDRRSLQACTVRNGAITARGFGIVGRRVRVSDVVITLNDGTIGVYSEGAVRARNLRTSGAALCGVTAWRSIRLESSTITGNLGRGVCAHTRIRLIDSAVVDNCTDPLPPSGGCSDLSSPGPPTLIDSTCGTSSGNSQQNPDWDVCTGD